MLIVVVVLAGPVGLLVENNDPRALASGEVVGVTELVVPPAALRTPVPSTPPSTTDVGCGVLLEASVAPQSAGQLLTVSPTLQTSSPQLMMCVINTSQCVSNQISSVDGMHVTNIHWYVRHVPALLYCCIQAVCLYDEI